MFQTIQSIFQAQAQASQSKGLLAETEPRQDRDKSDTSKHIHAPAHTHACLVSTNREIVQSDFASAVARNRRDFLCGKPKATSEYIYDNQRQDASAICDIMYRERKVRAISIVKKTKVGMDGLMIEIARQMTTHPDDDFVIPYDHVFFVTAMSNLEWETEMKAKMPTCFSGNVYHHGKLKRKQELLTKLRHVRNALIINDEIDTGDGEHQVLHQLYDSCHLLDLARMEEHNLRFIFVSATMVRELRELRHWGAHHRVYRMTIPAEYVGHQEFLERGVVQEYFPLDTPESAARWLDEDVCGRYGPDDPRVHLVRIADKHLGFLEAACAARDVRLLAHTSDDRLANEELEAIFANVSRHTVIAVKGLFRRANLIPTAWKAKIGAVHEQYSATYDTNVQIQGLVGRMCRYWRFLLDAGHKTGPYRTSTQAMREYQRFNEAIGQFEERVHETTTDANANTEALSDVFKGLQYQCVHRNVFVEPNYVKNLRVPAEKASSESVTTFVCRVARDDAEAKAMCEMLGYAFRPKAQTNAEGFFMTNVVHGGQHQRAVSVADVLLRVHRDNQAVRTTSGRRHTCERMAVKSRERLKTGEGITFRTSCPCYLDVVDKHTYRRVVFVRIRSDEDQSSLARLDEAFPEAKRVAETMLSTASTTNTGTAVDAKVAKKAQLLQMCRERGIKNLSGKSKSQLLALLSPDGGTAVLRA